MNNKRGTKERSERAGNSGLEGIEVLDLSTALPGPLAAARLAEMGASVTKLEPPWGDLLEGLAPGWYQEINQLKKVRRVDLKSDSGRSILEQELALADLLVTTNRPSALERLGLEPDRVLATHPRLCFVAIVGELPPQAEQSGHDLTYQAGAGLLVPPRIPRFPLADLMGAERAVQAALALLLSRERCGRGGWEWVSLTRAAEAFRPVLLHGLTSPEQILGGESPRYTYYRSRDGWVTLAALEDRLWIQFLEAIDRSDLRDEPADTVAACLREIFAGRTSQEWQEMARERRFPLQSVEPPG